MIMKIENRCIFVLGDNLFTDFDFRFKKRIELWLLPIINTQTNELTSSAK